MLFLCGNVAQNQDFVAQKGGTGGFESDRQGNKGGFPGKGIEKGSCTETVKHGKQRLRQLWGKFG